MDFTRRVHAFFPGYPHLVSGTATEPESVRGRNNAGDEKAEFFFRVLPDALASRFEDIEPGTEVFDVVVEPREFECFGVQHKE